MQHTQLERPVSLETWKTFLSEVDSATVFHDHASAFEGSQPLNITDELKQILDDFGPQQFTAVFAVGHGMVESVWFDPFHHYFAIVFSKATGDDDDFVMINSFSPGRSET
jgi:hypothetical protein